MEKTARFLVERSHALLDRAGMNFLPEKKQHNIWAERPPRPNAQTVTGNQQQKNLIDKLPEELILHIMRHLDAPSLLCLRRASRNFMRLFGDREFHPYHGIGSKRWQPENVNAIGKNRELRVFRELLKRDRLCGDCVSARQGPNSKMDEYLKWAENPLHCSGCEVDHPALCFSKKQRNLVSSKRICIAREGFVRLCRHKSFTWADLQKQVLEDIAPTRRGCTVFACNCKHERREIRFAFYGQSYRLVLARGSRWMRDISSFEYDWDDDDKTPLGEKDWCPDRDYTWLCKEAEDRERKPLVPESSWYRMVEPGSLGITGDEGTFGVTWCRERSCPNYWKCFEIRRGRRVYIPCEEGCEES